MNIDICRKAIDRKLVELKSNSLLADYIEQIDDMRNRLISFFNDNELENLKKEDIEEFFCFCWDIFKYISDENFILSSKEFFDFRETMRTLNNLIYYTTMGRKIDHYYNFF